VVQRAKHDRPVVDRLNEAVARVLPGLRSRPRTETGDQELSPDDGHVVQVVAIGAFAGVGPPYDLLGAHTAVCVQTEPEQLVGPRRDRVHRFPVGQDGVDVPAQLERVSPTNAKRCRVNRPEFGALGLLVGRPTEVEDRVQGRGRQAKTERPECRIGHRERLNKLPIGITCDQTLGSLLSPAAHRHEQAHAGRLGPPDGHRYASVPLPIRK
jgi:hypothetical protein